MKKFYITTAIDYANAAPHIGHAYEKIASDVLARWHRNQGHEVFFLTGTDEHGAKNVRSAESTGMKVEDFVAEHRKEFKQLLQTFNISNNDFIYTSDKDRHWPGAQEIWRILKKKGDLYKATYKGIYCVGHEAFITEKDLENGLCPDHNQKPEMIEEENYFFKLTKYSEQIIKLIESGELKILPDVRKNEVISFLNEGVEDISFSRPSKDISWGIPVPDDTDHTMYVWCDALTNYISALGFASDNIKNFEKFWPADLHLIGKDILRFHAVIWPSMLLSAGIKLPRAIFVHGMILSGGKKMSKTIGNVIDPIAMASEYGADAFRYFLMREIPFGDDGDFTKERFRDVYDGSLAHGIGNLVSRTAAMITRFHNGTLAKSSEESLINYPTRRVLRQEVSAKKVALEGVSLSRYYYFEVLEEFKKAMEEYRLTEAITILSQFYALLDGYIQDYEPYKVAKTDSEKSAHIMWNVAWHILRTIPLLYPFMPETADKILKIFSVDMESADGPDRVTINSHSPLFPIKDT